MKVLEKHPSGSDIVFNPEYYSYFLDNVQLTSVTTFIGRFFPKFDVELVSERYAKKYNLNQAQVKADWKREGEQAIQLGNTCHAYAEALIKDKALPEISSKKEKDYFNAMKFYLKQLFLKGIKPIKTEYIIGSKRLQLGGTIDLLLRKGKVIYIYDWKTNKTINIYNTFQTAKEPIAYLDDCLFNRYSLQLNFYKAILKQEEYFKKHKFNMAILHVTQKGVIEMPVEDMTKEVSKMIHF